MLCDGNPDCHDSEDEHLCEAYQVLDSYVVLTMVFVFIQLMYVMVLFPA